MASKIKVAASDRTVDHRANEAHLKQRVKELEDEVQSLKRRLDELRKAKNTTVLKREREVLEVGAPFGRRDSKTVEDKDVQKRLSEKDKWWQKELDDLRKKFAAEMEALRKSSQTDKDCGHEQELTFLRQRNEELENDNSALTTQNRELRERVDSLLSDLSVKEASWCQMEEKFKLELKRSWGEKYKQWMEETEAKIADLQRTNNLLRTYLKKQRPEGRDPTGQDPDFDDL
ncbi:Elks/rab6-interacting/cast family member 1-like [Plakobranchus ocellatus]|uniref:Elks/rab6-interacting/cast family member 1-like n=1 Tax=Plakobranchus ocellatus TaxID=259542 RepID=A0AAV3ZVJ8_9GAST|nr:Elks/rab6-interacting/cast family member 1-like [Plakobranchus ocellatus]